MNNYQFTRVSFVPRPISVRWSNQIIPYTKSWTPTPLERSSYFSDNTESSLNKFSRQSDSISPNNNKQQYLKPLLISLGILLILASLTALIMSIYVLILVNKTTTTSTTVTTITTTSATTVTTKTTSTTSTTSTTTTTTSMTTTTSLPSQCYSHVVINDTTRLTTTTGTAAICDTSVFTTSTTWVRFNGAGGTQIPTSPPSPNHCGTQATGWYVGSMPAASTTVTGSVCYNWSTSTCSYANSISVTNCGSYYVYGLVSPPVCNLRYCTV